MSNWITFPITNTEKIEVKRFSDDEEISRYEEVSIIYESRNKEYLLYVDDFISEALSVLQKLLQKAIDGELELHNSLIEKGIGLLSNDNLQSMPELVMIEEREGEVWVGDKYLLWDSMDYQTWIYNLNGEVTIEITPTYKWHFDEPGEEDDEYVSYEEFRKNYKTCFAKTISKDIAESWLNNCNDVLERLI